MSDKDDFPLLDGRLSLPEKKKFFSADTANAVKTMLYPTIMILLFIFMFQLGNYQATLAISEVRHMCGASVVPLIGAPLGILEGAYVNNSFLNNSIGVNIYG